MTLLLPLLLSACGTPTEETPPAPTGPPSLVLVTLDTVRADRMGAYGYDKARTPTFDALTNSGVRFDRAYTDVPLTTPAHASILSGLYPPAHGIRTNGDAALADEIETVAESLQNAGYRTGAVVSAFVTARPWNLDQGFEHYVDDLPHVHEVGGKWMQERLADSVIDEAEAWLAQRRPDEPFFLWVHLYDAHFPYSPPAPWSEEFADNPYDGEIAFMDAQLARLVPAVEEAAGDRGAAWMLLSDHGEALEHEHGEPTHGLLLFDPTMRIPFVLRPAEPLKQPLVDADPVSVVDVMPTLLSLAGLEVPDGLPGLDLSPALEGERPAQGRDGVYLESYAALQRFGYHPEIGWVWDSKKLIDTPSPAMFDIVDDPGETQNLIAGNAALADELREHIAQVRSATAPTDQEAIAPEHLEALAALGYVGAGLPIDEASAPDIDVKDRLKVVHLLESARAMTRQHKDLGQAKQMYEEALSIDDSLVEAYSGLATTVSRLGDQDQAIAIVKKALEQHPDSDVLETKLATFHSMKDDYEGALAIYEEALIDSPDNQFIRTGVLRTLVKVGRAQESINRARAWLEENPEALYLKAHLGVVLVQLGRLDEAEPLLRASLADHIPRQLVHYSLALIHYANKDIDKAIDELALEVASYPRDPDARLSLAKTLFEAKRFSEAVPHFRVLAEGHSPQRLEGRIGLTQALLEGGDPEAALLELGPLLESHPASPSVLAVQYRTLETLGRMDEAKAVDERFKEAVKEQRKASMDSWVEKQKAKKARREANAE